jgi:hypothetical protein
MWHVWGREEVCTEFWRGSLSEREHWGDPDIDGRIILRWIVRKWEWMEFAHDEERWGTLVSTVVNLLVP